jgi:glutamyl-tRNA reductase
VSVSFNAVELLRQKLGTLKEKVGLVVGSGQTARLTAQIMLSNKVSDLIIVNRNPEKGRALAEQLGTDPQQVYPLPRLPHALAQTDLVISCTGAPHAVIQPAETAHAMTRRSQRPLYMVDIAVPRDIDPEVREIPGVFAWDIDDIKKISEENLDKRRAEVHHVQGIVLEEVETFMRWLGALAVVPTITNLRQHADEIRRAELERVRHAFGDLTERQAALLDELTNRIVNKLMHGPTTRLKEAASTRDAARYAEVVQYLFALNETGNEAN